MDGSWVLFSKNDKMEIDNHISITQFLKKDTYI